MVFRALAAGLLATALAGCLSYHVAPATPGDVTIAGSRVFPESVTSDAAGNLYNSSNGGTIYRTLAGSRTAEPWIVPNAQNGLRSLFGVLVDKRRGFLFACDNPNLFARETGKSYLVQFELGTGRLMGRYELPGDGPSACNDIAVAADESVWVSETSGGQILKLSVDGQYFEVFARGEHLIGIDGLAFAEDGTLYINNVRRNLLQRVLRKADGSYAGLQDLKLPVALGGPDGLRPLGGNRFIQGEGSSGRVAVLEVSGDTVEMTDVATGLDGPVGVTVVGDTAYVVEGKIGYLIDPALRDKSPEPFMIRAFALPERP